MKAAESCEAQHNIQTNVSKKCKKAQMKHTESYGKPADFASEMRRIQKPELLSLQKTSRHPLQRRKLVFQRGCVLPSITFNSSPTNAGNFLTSLPSDILGPYHSPHLKAPHPTHFQNNLNTPRARGSSESENALCELV